MFCELDPNTFVVHKEALSHNEPIIWYAKTFSNANNLTISFRTDFLFRIANI